MMNNGTQLGIIFLIMLLFHNVVECMAINTMITYTSFAPKQIHTVIERRSKAVWFLAIGGLCISVLLIMRKHKNSNEIKKPNPTVNNSIISNSLLNTDVSIVDYDIQKHSKVVEEIVKQGPDALDDTAGSSKQKKISDSMNDLQNIGTTKILINKDACPVGFINFRVNDYMVGYILLLAVDKNNQRKGYGRLLLQHAIEELKSQNALSINIDVLSENKPAKKLYEKLNFVFGTSEIRPGVVQGTYNISQSKSI